MERSVSGREFRSEEKRGCGVGKTKRGRGTKWRVAVDGAGIPLGGYLHSASPSEVRLAGTTLGTIRVIADRGYDTDPLREQDRLARKFPPAHYKGSLTVYRAFFHIACFMITLRRVS